jgi:glycolate oxidase FAD binding subunit
VEYLVDGMAPSRVMSPSSIDELSSALQQSHQAGEAVIPWGGGTRMHVGGLPRRYDVAVDLTRLDRIVEYEPADLTVIVEAGIRMATLEQELASRGQRLPFDPPFPDEATIGGSLASNAVGPLRSGFGGIRDLVIGMKVVHADGVVTKSGGKVVKNVSGYDLMRPHIGAFGTLGVIAEAAFKLVPLPAATRTFAAAFDSFEDAGGACKSMLRVPFQPERFTLWTGRRAGDAAASLAGGPVSASHDVSLLILTVSAGHAAVERMLAETRKAVVQSGATWHGTVAEREAEGLWSALEPAPPDTPILTARATLKPYAGFDYLGRITNAPARGLLNRDTVFHVGFGTILAHWSSADAPLSSASGDDLEAVSLVIEGCRSAAAVHGVVPVLERCPTELKRRIDVWGEPGPAIEIMRNMKHEFDPAGTLNPGRFMAGI